MKPTPISTDQAPRAVGPYSQAIEADGWLFLSGQIALDPATGALIEGDVAEETERIMRNIAAVLQAAGSSFGEVCKSTIFLTSLQDFATVNSVYRSFVGPVLPARSTVQVAALPLGARVEIEVIARRSSSSF